MKVKVLKEFTDKKENILRKPGDTFECTPERFDEIKQGLSMFCSQCKWIEEIKVGAKDGRSTKANKGTIRNNDK